MNIENSWNTTFLLYRKTFVAVKINVVEST